jgi:hypothetical protein
MKHFIFYAKDICKGHHLKCFRQLDSDSSLNFFDLLCVLYLKLESLAQVSNEVK